MNAANRLVLTVCLGVMGLLPVASRSFAATVESGSGLRLDVSDEGRITGLHIGQVQVPLPSPGGLAVADFKQQPTPVNLVPNGGFEDAAKGWQLGKGQSLDTAVFHSGKTSARLEVPGPEKGSSNLGVFVPVKPNTRYRVGLWLRREKVAVCGVYSCQYDDKHHVSDSKGQQGVTIPKQDGVWLPLTWEIVTESKTTRLSLRADIYHATGTLWLDDLFVEEYSEGMYEPVAARVEAVPGGVALHAAMSKRGLDLQATLRGDKECIRIDGTISDTTGRDRALGVKFALPLDLSGWTWHLDAHDREPIDTKRMYRHTYKCVSGVGVCSIYPWMAVSSADAGLSLALPLSQGPRAFLLQHDQRVPEMQAVFFFGLARDAGKNPSRATFSLVLYPHDPAWGMRSAMQRYYKLFPESFVKRPTFEGYLNYADLERFDPKTHQMVVWQKDRFEDASDFGEGYKFVWGLHGCYDYRQVPYEDQKLPADETVFSLLANMIKAEQAKPRGYAPTADTIKKVVFGPDGNIAYIADTRYWRAHEGYNHSDLPGWGFNFRVHEDPDISPALALMARQRAERTSADPTHRPWDATFTADAIEGYMANGHCLNFRREHFATTVPPLVFGVKNLQPAILNTIWDFHAKAWWPISQEHKITVYGNANQYEQVFTAPWVDVPMTEGSWEPRFGRWERYLRAIAHRKIWRHWHAWDDRGGYSGGNPGHVQRHFRYCLAYAIYPALGTVQVDCGNLDMHRALYRQYVPAIEELSVAGWDPVPLATATQEVVVERYGEFSQGELHFTLLNEAKKPVETLLKPDWNALGVPAGEELVVLDILPGGPQLALFPREGCRVTVEPEGCRAIWVGTRSQAARHGLRMAAATLAKIERLFATEMPPGAKAIWQDALGQAQAGSQADASQALKSAEAIQQAARQSLPAAISTRAPVDLAKLLLRVRSQASLVPVALLGIQITAPRKVDAVPGRSLLVPCVFDPGNARVTDAQCRVASPWPELAAKSQVAPAGQRERMAELAVPAEPPRRLLPYLFEIFGKTDAGPVTIATPIDVEIGDPLEVKLSPVKVLRNQEQTLKVTVVNRLDENAQLAFKWAAPGKVKITPAEMPLAIPAGGTVESSLVLALDKDVAIGSLRLRWTAQSKNARFTSAGPVFLTVDDATGK